MNAVADATIGGAFPASAAAAAAQQNLLKRFMFYFERYNNHVRSVKLAQKTTSDAVLKSAALQEQNGTGSNAVQFLIDAVNTIIDTKRALACCYGESVDSYAAAAAAVSAIAAAAIHRLPHLQINY